MKKIAIVTDSNSGITQAQAKRLGIEVIPMPFFIDGKLYLEDITLTQEEFYQHLTQDSDISTSQPAPGEIWNYGIAFWKSTRRLYTFRCPVD